MIKDPSLIETPATNDRPPKDILSLVFSVIVVLLIISFALYEYRSHKERFLKDIENDLNSIANLKSQEISRYIRERLEDGNILFRRDTFYNSIKKIEEDPADKANQEYLKKWLNRYGSHYQYENAFILDKEGAIILSAPRDQKHVPAGISSELPKILQRNTIELVNFYRDDKNGLIHLGITAPVLSENPADTALGAMVLLINPEAYLYPFIKKWPVLSQTAETLLVQRDGNYVLFLNDLRFSENSALNLRLEIDKNKRVPAVMAVEGRRGFVEGLDYRGTPVIAYIMPVENTPWLLVAKMDKKEAFAPITRDMWSVVFITASVILAIIAIRWFLSRRRAVLFYKEQYALSEELRRLQYELVQAKETQYRSLIENLPQKVFLKDRNSVYISCNQNYANDLGIDAKDIKGKTDHDFFEPKLAEKYIADDKRIMDTGKIGNFEEDYLSLTGAKEKSRRLVINTVKIPVKDKTGKITGIFGLFWDITDRKKAEEDIKALNKQIEYILGATKTGLDIIDSKYNLIYIDPEWKKVYGDPAGKKCYEYFMGRKSVCEGCGLAKALKTKKIVVSEEILTREGNRPIQVTSIPFQDEKGNWLVAEVNTDISERKKYEEELQVSERKFRTIFENARDGILVVEPATKKIHMSNRAISQMLGYSDDELTGLSIMDIHPEKDLAYVLQQFERQNIGEITLAKDMPVKRKDGSVFYADINAAVISLDGKKFMLGFFHDITPERVAVIERARAEKLQTNADMKSRLMSTVSHEFRSPLAAIKEGIALVLEGLIGQINPEQKDILHTAKKNVDRLNRLVENVLTLGKIEAGKMEIVREDSDINRVALETARSIYVLANDKGIDLEVKVDEKIPKVSFDSDKITQVITNLLSNAIKFTSQGKITLTTKLESDTVHVTVEDTGPGIEPEDITKLFDIFETLGGTRLAKGGTGLGLSISKDIISAHKGKIWVESTPGKGSVFHFTLPLKI